MYTGPPKRSVIFAILHVNTLEILKDNFRLVFKILVHVLRFLQRDMLYGTYITLV